MLLYLGGSIFTLVRGVSSFSFSFLQNGRGLKLDSNAFIDIRSLKLLEKDLQFLFLLLSSFPFSDETIVQDWEREKETRRKMR